MVLSWNNYKGINQKKTVGERLSILVREQEHKQLIINVEKEVEGNRRRKVVITREEKIWLILQLR